MKKNKWMALLLSAVLMAQPVVYASAQTVSETSAGEVAVNVEETEKMNDETEGMTETEPSDSRLQETVDADESEQSVLPNTESEEASSMTALNEGTMVLHQSDVDSDSVNAVPDGMAVGGYIPSDLDNNTPVYYGNSLIRTYASTVPAVWPSNGIDGIRSTYPSVRDQNPYGTCWAFSSLGLAEFDLINKNQGSSDIDLSELQLAYFTFNYVIDPLGGTKGDTAKFYNENYNQNGGYLNYGGNFEEAMRRLGQWISPTGESNVPYSNASTVLTSGLDDAYAYDKSGLHLENAYIISIKNNPDDVKQQIMKHGAVGTSYTHKMNGMTYGEEYNAYYDCADTLTTNGDGGHAVMIVGWDDNFSKDNFTSEEKPTSNGAWLIRNSWGSYFDYFWMSYETESLADSAYVFDFSADDGYDNNYQLDGGIESQTQYSEDSDFMVANVFSVPKQAGVKSESLGAVSLSFTHSTSVDYKIEIYTDLLSAQPYYGTYHPEATTIGTTTYAGVYTIPLNEVVELKPGTNYSVVVTINSGAKIDCEYARCYKENPSLDDGKYIWECAVNRMSYKSFYKFPTSKTYTANDYNYRIKAFTSNNPYTITYKLNGGTNNENNPSACGGSAIVLQNPTREGCVFDGWYTDSNYQTKITEIPENASGDYTLYAKWSSVLGDKVNSYTLTLDGTIGINFYMDLPDELAADSEAYMEFTLPNGNVSDVKISEAVQESGYYVFSCGVAAKEMASEVKARMVSRGQGGKVYTYSVKKYADYILSHQDDQTAYKNVTGLMKAMLNYGASAQELLQYNLTTLANESLSDADKVLDDVDFKDYGYSAPNFTTVEGLNYYGSSLVMKSDTSVKDYFTVDDGHSIEEYQFKVQIGTGSIKSVQPVAYKMDGKTYYYVEISNIKAQDLGKSMTVYVNRINDTIEAALQYGPFNYGYIVYNQTPRNEANFNMTQALYQYWYEAVEYIKIKGN